MRVIAGTARRLTLKTLPGRDTRPTTDRIKETLFNMLQPDLYDAAFLDLFAGSGQIGIEALSRGASSAVFVDNSRVAAACIKENLSHTHFTERSRVIMSDAIGALRRLDGAKPFQIIFMDPPYLCSLERQVLEYLTHTTLADENTLIVVEGDLDTPFDYLDELGYEIVKRKEYKTNLHMFLRRRA